MLNKLFDFYYKNYKQILVIPFIILAINLGIIGYTFFTTGSLFYSDSSLVGGVSFTFSYNQEVNVEELELELINDLGTEDVSIVILRSSLSSIVMGYEIQTEEGITLEEIQNSIETHLGITLDITDISFGTQSSAVGESFLSDAGKLLIIGFILMSLVSYAYFKNVVPALSITFSTLSDFVGIIAMLNLFQIKIGVATIGALLMMIGYSTDSDILLATNILKRKEGTLKTRMKRAISTELTMALAAIVTFSIMYLLSTVEIIKHIALVLLIGIIFDVINTWGQNASLQRIYKENKK